MFYSTYIIKDKFPIKKFVNLQVSDYKGRILTVNSAHSGRTHDARVWRASLICNHLEEMYTAGRRDAWLLGNCTFN